MLLFRLILIIAFTVLIQLYVFQAIKTAFQTKILVYSYLAISVSIIGFATWSIISFNRSVGFTHAMSYALGLLMSLLVFQIIIIGFLLLEDIFRAIRYLTAFIIKNNTNSGVSFQERRKIISQLAVSIAALPFTSLIYGMVHGKYNYKVIRHELFYDDLPANFDGFTITQISDIHSGSFDNATKVKYGIDLVNSQQSDLILFTGDLVNNTSDEMLPWKDIFAELKAPYGKFSIMGNHDYGDYARWENDKAKEENLQALFKIQQEMGFDLMLNESRYIYKGNEKIALIGVENWGKGFKKAGDIKQAMKNVTANDFKIFLSHDPSHWEEEILPHPYPIQLTLSGHTHGMQFGIEIPGWIKWSPVKWRYKQWAGIYEGPNRQLINVNRGFGFIGYSGRVGIWPEITVITLRRNS